ncbi:serine/threonine-protein kinase [Streptomyces sp. NPDC053755]|uniref:serine/threonine-protein kinase n=1 Tax=Streptomyces sp. NPDC053755 TaxID=3155815 RepID=UPI003434E416
MGTLIGTYEVEHKLGEGGMGTVYLARSRGGRAVAVKVARPELAADPGFRARFRAEVAAARRVGGFHTAQVVDADPDADAPWLATAYIPGPTLAGLVAAEGALPEPRLRALGAALAEALEAIHGCGLVHRDLKPGNIVMASDGPRVLDFGIARAVESTRLTATGTAFGTPGYLAPEQALGEEVTGAADVFALGAVLVAAAGGRAFGGGTPMGLMYRSVHEPADLATVPAGLRDLVESCLAKDPVARPTPGGILDALTAPAPAVPPPTPTVVAAPLVPADVQDAVPPHALPTRGAVSPHALPTRGAVSPHALPTQGAGGGWGGGGPRDAVPGPVPARPVGPPGAPAPTRSSAPAPVASPPPMPSGPPDGPVLVAADGECGVVADAGGIAFELFGEEAEFGWDEIGSVAYETARRDRRLRVVVTLRDGSSYDCEVNGRAALVAGWTTQLDLVLDRYLSE